MSSLTRDEARARKALLTVTAMAVDLDLDAGRETFGSRTRIEFDATPDAATFVDLKADSVQRVVLNDVELSLTEWADGRLPLTGLAAHNTLLVEATMAYSHDGQGLHRATDPADGKDYVYGHLFLDAAPRVFACFDQPDLKAPYAVTVRAPQDWIVLGNGAATQESPGQWRLATTLPLSTYFVTVCAGPYVSVRDEHDGIPLGVHARASLADALHNSAEQILEITRQSFDYYHRLFGIRYPFGDYHQVFVPEFNAGAMENPGCVTFRDQYLYRGAATRQEILTRSNTVSHEMAHQWFGDLVTMQWWDDLWLNESFAEYMSHRTLVAATEFTDAWVDSSMVRKSWGYAAERTPSTHPVAGAPAPDGDTALQNFDGISYAKGAATLRQLIAHIGDDTFIAGVRAYLQEFSYGNGTLADFLGAMEAAAGRDLSAWSAAWLETAGLDTLRLDLAEGTLTRTVPTDHPADRPHDLDVAGFADGREVWRVPVAVRGDVTTVEGLAPAELVVPNAGDLTWATVLLDEQTLAAVPTRLGQVPDASARAVVWTGMFDAVCLGDLDPRVYLATITGSWPAEQNDSILSTSATKALGRVVSTFLPHAEQETALAAIAAAGADKLASAEAGSAAALVAARTVARSSADAELLRTWLEAPPQGLAGDADFRWLVVGRLAQLGAVDDVWIATEQQRDNTMAGNLAALTARAAQPTAEAKAWAWSEFTTNRERTNYELLALASGLWRGSEELITPYAARYFAEVPAMKEWVGEDALAKAATVAFPARVVTPENLAAAQDSLSGDALTPAVRRAITDCAAELNEALRSQQTFGGSVQG